MILTRGLRFAHGRAYLCIWLPCWLQLCRRSSLRKYRKADIHRIPHGTVLAFCLWQSRSLLAWYAGTLHEAESTFKLKPMKWLLLSIFSIALVVAVVSNTSIYMMAHVLGFSPEKQSLTFILSTLINLAWIPAVNFLSQKYDKKYAYAGALGVSATTALIVVTMGIRHVHFDRQQLCPVCGVHDCIIIWYMCFLDVIFCNDIRPLRG